MSPTTALGGRRATKLTPRDDQKPRWAHGGATDPAVIPPSPKITIHFAHSVSIVQK
jgi:hypothetical protein